MKADAGSSSHRDPAKTSGQRPEPSADSRDVGTGGVPVSGIVNRRVAFPRGKPVRAEAPEQGALERAAPFTVLSGKVAGRQQGPPAGGRSASSRPS